MAPLTLVEEARADATEPLRLGFLASDLDPTVRQAARANPRCPEAIIQLLQMAETKPTQLRPSLLDILAGLGPQAAEIAAKHPATPDDALVGLVLRGYTKTILQYRSDRTGNWLLNLARQNPALLAYLSRDRSVPWNIRRRAHGLHRSTGATATATTAPSTNEQAVLTATLRQKLRNRQESPVFTAEEARLLRATPALQRLAARHPLLQVPQLQWLDEQHPHGQARETLLYRLEHHALDAEILAQLARDGDWEVRAALARNPHLPDFLLPYLAEDQDWWVRASAAESPNASPEQLAALAHEADHAVIRENAARHPHTPGETLMALADDGEALVRLQVARNPSTPPEALARLAGDERYATREAVAAHPLAPPEVVQRLAGDANERVALVARLRLSQLSGEGLEEALATRRRNVKLAVASRHEIPVPLLRQLARDRNPLVRAQVSLHSELPDPERETLQADRDPAVQRVALASDPSARPEVLHALPRHDVRIRQGLSRNAATPPPVLDDLSDDALEDVRLSVVLNPASPEGAIQRRLPEQPLRPGIRKHPLYDRVKPSLHEMELQEAENPRTSAEALDALTGSDAPRVRQAVGLHPHAAATTLLRLARDDHKEVRRGLIQRADLSRELQGQLALDNELAVRLALVERGDLAPEVMLMLASQPNEDEALLLSLVKHPAVSGDVLATLARQPAVGVRETVARHKLTPISVQIQLASDPQTAVVDQLLKNSACGPEVLAILAKQARLRLRVAQHSRTSSQTLEALAFDPGYAQLLRLEALLRRAPPVLRDHPQVQRGVKWMRQRTSRNAFKELNLLAAVIRHPSATALAVQFASRLSHPNIEAARQERRARLASPLPADPGDPRE